MPSVLRPWVMDLPLREQGTLLTVVRGGDLTPKYPLDSPARRLVSALRYAFMVPADEREVDSEPGTFMSRFVPGPDECRLSAFGHYPQHYISHLLHAVEVLAYRHPDPGVAVRWLVLYRAWCHSLHLVGESFVVFEARMSEDRIALGNVVA